MAAYDEFLEKQRQACSRSDKRKPEVAGAPPRPKFPRGLYRKGNVI